MNQFIPIIEDKDHKIYPQGVDLCDSYILDWKLENDNLQIELELSIWPECQYYKTPIPNEYTYYHKGILKFNSIQSISGFMTLDPKDCTIDPDGTKDWGNIYGLRKENHEILFETDFTDIRLNCKDIELILKNED